MRLLGGQLALVFVLGTTAEVWGLTAQEAIGRAQLALRQVEHELTDVALTKESEPPTAEERLAAGELFLREENYDQAIASFSQVLELHRQKKAKLQTRAEALFLIGEGYFLDEQLLSAERSYRAVAELASVEPYAIYGGRALGRLVDIALRTGRLEGLNFVFKQLDLLPGKDTTGARTYARGKAHFAKRQYRQAIEALKKIRRRSVFFPQGQYLLGVAYINQAMSKRATKPTRKEAESVPPSAKQFARAIIQFQRLARLKVKTKSHRHVRDLAWMALARIFYETENALDAVDAYQHVAKESPEFAVMLSELSWAYVRLKDYDEAQRVLEVLEVVSPEKLEFAEGALLQADLLLRAKKYDSALSAYRVVRSRFEPLQEKVDAFLKKTRDPAVYYDRVIENRLGIKTQDALPPILMDWLSDGDDDAVFALIEDVTRARRLLAESEELVERMNAVLHSATRSQAFPDLRGQLLHTVALINRLSLVRRDLALGADATSGGSSNAELKQVRAARRKLMSRFEWLPVRKRDFARRDEAGRRGWMRLSQKLQRIQLEADKLQALVNGLARVLTEADRFGVPNRPGFREQLHAELEANQGDLSVYREAILLVREQLERGRVGVGFGDARYAGDQKLRSRFSTFFGRELALLKQGAAGQEAAAFARDVEPVTARLTKVEKKLTKIRRAFEAAVTEGADSLLNAVRAEQELASSYADDLDVLDQSARLLVGESAKRSFALVRERLNSIVLRADVGIAQQAWEVRAAHLDKLRKLQRARAKEQRALDGELNEVLDREVAR